jgi:hypothetical protein
MGIEWIELAPTGNKRDDRIARKRCHCWLALTELPGYLDGIGIR